MHFHVISKQQTRVTSQQSKVFLFVVLEPLCFTHRTWRWRCLVLRLCLSLSLCLLRCSDALHRHVHLLLRVVVIKLTQVRDQWSANNKQNRKDILHASIKYYEGQCRRFEQTKTLLQKGGSEVVVSMFYMMFVLTLKNMFCTKGHCSYLCVLQRQFN